MLSQERKLLGSIHAPLVTIAQRRVTIEFIATDPRLPLVFSPFPPFLPLPFNSPYFISVFLYVDVSFQRTIPNITCECDPTSN